MDLLSSLNAHARTQSDKYLIGGIRVLLKIESERIAYRIFDAHQEEYIMKNVFGKFN